MGSNESAQPEQAVEMAVEEAPAASPTPSAFGIGRLRRIPAAGAFGTTNEQLRTWLGDNMDAVGEVTGHTWTAAVTDRSASGAPTSLLATSSEGRAVFEADPGETTSESLGRLITGLVESGSTMAVWLAADPRPEHVAAVAWLNSSDEAAFYLIHLEAVRIDNSAPAPWMTLMVRPGRDEAEDMQNVAAPPVEASAPAAAAAFPSSAEAAAPVEPGAMADEAADAPAATTALAPASAAPGAEPEGNAKPESSTFDELVADTGRRVDDWRRIALGATRAADETGERH